MKRRKRFQRSIVSTEKHDYRIRCLYSDSFVCPLSIEKSIFSDEDYLRIKTVKDEGELWSNHLIDSKCIFTVFIKP